MKTQANRLLLASMVALVATGCASSGGVSTSSPTPPTSAGAQPLRIVPTNPASDADVAFMTEMIPHHAQAIKMAKWAPTHGASDAVKRMCERIVVAQSDEIALIQNWLRDRGKEVPPADATHHRHVENGVAHNMLMPGMLTDEEMAQLDRARGVEFDRLFLTFMIKHHNGAAAMVDGWKDKYGAGMDETAFKLAADIYADQTSEIDRMQKMLAALPGDGR
jgi:uncharacterized protein (DUF305 family)